MNLYNLEVVTDTTVVSLDFESIDTTVLSVTDNEQCLYTTVLFVFSKTEDTTILSSGTMNQRHDHRTNVTDIFQ